MHSALSMRKSAPLCVAAVARCLGWAMLSPPLHLNHSEICSPVCPVSTSLCHLPLCIANGLNEPAHPFPGTRDQHDCHQRGCASFARAFAARRAWCATIFPAVHHWFHGRTSHNTPCNFGCYGRCFASDNFGGATTDVAWSQHICAVFQTSHGHARTRLASMGSCHQGRRQRW